MGKNIRDLFSGNLRNPTLREVAARQEEELQYNRTLEEDAVHALMPGDVSSEHPLEHEPVEYLHVPFTELKEKLKDKNLDLEEERKIRRALAYQRAFHQEGIEILTKLG